MLAFFDGSLGSYQVLCVEKRARALKQSQNRAAFDTIQDMSKSVDSLQTHHRE